MTTQADYTAEQWQDITDAAGMVAAMVTGADLSGPVGIFQELKASVNSQTELSKQSSNPLLQSIAATLSTVDKDKPSTNRPDSGKRGEEAVAEMQGQVKAAVDLVAQKSQTDADAYKAYLMDVGVRVAKAAKEGGFLGMGGTKVSGDERAALEKLATMLGVSAPSV